MRIFTAGQRGTRDGAQASDKSGLTPNISVELEGNAHSIKPFGLANPKEFALELPPYKISSAQIRFSQK